MKEGLIDGEVNVKFQDSEAIKINDLPEFMKKNGFDLFDVVDESGEVKIIFKSKDDKILRLKFKKYKK